MNWFIIAGAILWFLAAGHAAYNGNRIMIVVSVCYGIAQLALSVAK